jgi:hypothetical protein
MTTFLLSILLMITIVGAFALGVAAGYWVICAFLNFFDPATQRKQRAGVPKLAPSGD